MFNRKKIVFVRKNSSTETINLINAKHYPSLEKNPLLKTGILDALEKFSYLNKINRFDVCDANRGHFYSITFFKIRNSIAWEMHFSPFNLHMQGKPVEISNDIVALQKIYSEVVTKIYKKWKKRNTQQCQNMGMPVYCGESCGLFYGFLKKREGINSHKMRIVCFHNTTDRACNHNLIIYAENDALLKLIDSTIGFGEDNAKRDSYLAFMEILAQRNKEEVVLLIDPWSKDNKIIDLEIQEMQYENFFVGQEKKIQQKLCLQKLMDALLTESKVISLNNLSDSKPVICYVWSPIKWIPEEKMQICAPSSGSM